ncbi:f-box domain-containing protein [Caerostris extrusa]|uniref:F-box domain-containing protein n=1 Tax=Caerostris extrusa TaxID=172846 RepID=A0AAV4PQC1_CAEEX|nr:f-box domain-containing protein [Caerostris extrusa]
MSLVCSRWSRDYGTPCVWKTMKFYLPEHICSSEVYPEVRFARKYGSMFRHVEIICKRVRAHLLGVIWKQLKLFLQAMSSKSHLISIKFLNMGNYFSHLDDFIHNDVFKAIVNLFHSQEALRTVVFQDSRLTRNEAMELLKAIHHSDKHTIRVLNLRGFVVDGESNEINTSYLPNLSTVCYRMSGIYNFELDYTQMFEDILYHLYENLSSGSWEVDMNRQDESHESNLTLYCEGKKTPDFRGIPSHAWKYFLKSFP